MKKKSNKKMFSWMSPKIEIRDTKQYGKGVFAKDKIKKGDTVLIMGGYILSLEDDNQLTGIVADKPIEISDSFFIGPRNSHDLKLMPQHYINHSCDPNVGFKGTIFMVAIRDIKENEEISYDYAMVMNSHPDSNSYFTIECKCGSENCRKVRDGDTE